MRRRKAKIAVMKMEIANLVIGIERVRTEIGGGIYPPDGSNRGRHDEFHQAGLSPLAANAAHHHPGHGPGLLAGRARRGQRFQRQSHESLHGRARQRSFFDFDPTRLVESGKLSVPSPERHSNSAPYLYFKAVAAATPATAVQGGQRLQGNAAGFVNPTSYQILCPGLDGKYGTTETGPFYPKVGTNYDQANGLDDMSQFYRRRYGRRRPN